MINTIFNKIDPDRMHANEILAVYYHRSAATLYALYAAWGVAAFINNIPSFTTESSHDFFDFFTTLVAPVAVAAFFGALYFPRTGRLELFAAAALATLVVVFLVLTGLSAVHSTDPRAWVNFILNITHLVIPISRVAFIFRTLVWSSMKKGF